MIRSKMVYSCSTEVDREETDTFVLQSLETTLQEEQSQENLSPEFKGHFFQVFTLKA